MIRTAKKLVLASREKIVSLVLLPAFFLSALPQTACICADGHREAACPALRRHTSESAGGCCQTRMSRERSCCKNKATQLAASCYIAVHAGSCCHLVIDGPTPATVAKPGGGGEQWMLIAACPAEPVFSSAAELWPTASPAFDSTPPPRDVVIELTRLTI
jgi:hypothetical protein